MEFNANMLYCHCNNSLVFLAYNIVFCYPVLAWPNNASGIKTSLKYNHLFTSNINDIFHWHLCYEI